MMPAGSLEHHGDFDAFIYRRGFLLLPTGVGPDPDTWAARVTQGWVRVSLQGFDLLASPEVPLSLGHARDRTVALVGRAVDPYGNTADHEAISRSLAECASEHAFLERLDDLTGRFVVLESDIGGLRLYQDAVGMQTVFYARPGLEAVAASHALLVGEVVGRGVDDGARIFLADIAATRPSELSVKWLPGVMTPVTDVLALTPNTRLEVGPQRVSRFWPRSPRRPGLRVGPVIAEMHDVMRTALALVGAAQPLRMSLTAGLDSRVTLACLKGQIDNVTFFSHVNSDNPDEGNTHRVDLALASDLAQRFGLAHHIVEMGPAIDAMPGREPFERAWLQNVGLPLGLRRLVRSYALSWPGEALHIRSNVAEIGRANQSYHRAGLLGGAFDESVLARVWAPKLSGDARAHSAFREFKDLTRFDREHLLGYHAADLFYWEQRIGMWHALLCLESAMSHDTFTAYDNRRLLASLLRLPYGVRADARVFAGVIDRAWPELMAFPINPPEWPEVPPQPEAARRRVAVSRIRLTGVQRRVRGIRARIKRKTQMLKQSPRLRRTVSLMLGGRRSPVSRWIGRLIDGRAVRSR
jgi:hypothetical protein